MAKIFGYTIEIKRNGISGVFKKAPCSRKAKK